MSRCFSEKAVLAISKCTVGQQPILHICVGVWRHAQSVVGFACRCAHEGAEVHCTGCLHGIFAYSLFIHTRSDLLIPSYLPSKVKASLGLESHLFLVWIGKLE